MALGIPGLWPRESSLCFLSHMASSSSMSLIRIFFTGFRDQDSFILRYCAYLNPWGFLGGSAGKNLPAKARDPSLIPGSGRSPGGGNGNPLQNSCLKKPKPWSHKRVEHDWATKNKNNCKDFFFLIRSQSGVLWVRTWVYLCSHQPVHYSD